MTYPVPHDEPGRLSALQDLEILDTEPEALYDDVVALAAAICGTPIALVNFVDAERQWGKALVGLESSEAPRDAAFCARTSVAGDGMLVVPDCAADPAWAGNAQVVGEPHLRFYAGASIITDTGYALGSVCVADRRPRDLDAAQLEALGRLARQTASHLDLRRRSRLLLDLNEELRRVTVTDKLTGLANRTLLFDRLAQGLRLRRRSARPLGVVFCDLDGFKKINDELGHRAGDDALRLVAQRLTGAARDSDTVARLAGDEFVVVCPDLAEAEDVEVVAERLAAAVAVPTTLRGREVTPRISVGTAVAGDGDDADELIARADVAMYHAKRRTRLAGLAA